MKYISIFVISLIIISCDNNTTESEPQTLTGFWNAREVAQHFWLDHIRTDSVSGFGQLGIANNFGIIEWLPMTVEGKIVGNDISLLYILSDSTSVFNGEIITVNHFYGLWEIANDTIYVTYNKRITYN
jgi:hypothetical protein